MTDKKNPLPDALAGESVEGSTFDGLGVRLERYAKARRHQLAIIEHLRSRHKDDPNIQKLVLYLEHCSSYLAFRNYYLVDKVKLVRANFCKKHLICRMCAIRRAARMLRLLLERDEYVMQQNSGLVRYMLTLTVKNGFDLQERYDHLSNSVARLVQLRRQQLKRNTANKGEFTSLAGGVGSYEFTFSETHGWHPHVHFVVYKDGSKGINKNKLISEWLKATSDSYIIDVRPITEKEKGFIEVIKYSLKFSDLSMENLINAYQVLTSRRLVRSFGCMYGVQTEGSYLDDIKDLEDQPYIDMIYRYMEKRGYRLTEIREYDSLNEELKAHGKAATLPCHS